MRGGAFRRASWLGGLPAVATALPRPAGARGRLSRAGRGTGAGLAWAVEAAAERGIRQRRNRSGQDDGETRNRRHRKRASARQPVPAQIVGENNLRAVAEVAGRPAADVRRPTRRSPISATCSTRSTASCSPAPAPTSIRPASASSRMPAHEPYDEARDALALPLVEACVARGRAAVRHLPRLPGDERRLRRHRCIRRSASCPGA